MKITILFLGKSGGTCIYINRSLYQPGNKRDFINKIRDLYKDRKKCLSIAENNVETAEKYSMKHAVKKNGRNLCKHFPSDAFFLRLTLSPRFRYNKSSHRWVRYFRT